MIGWSQGFAALKEVKGRPQTAIGLAFLCREPTWEYRQGARRCQSLVSCPEMSLNANIFSSIRENIHAEVNMKIELIVGTWMMEAFILGDSNSPGVGPSKDYSRNLMTGSVFRVLVWLPFH